MTCLQKRLSCCDIPGSWQGGGTTCSFSLEEHCLSLWLLVRQQRRRRCCCEEVQDATSVNNWETKAASVIPNLCVLLHFFLFFSHLLSFFSLSAVLLHTHRRQHAFDFSPAALLKLHSLFLFLSLSRFCFPFPTPPQAPRHQHR